MNQQKKLWCVLNNHPHKLFKDLQITDIINLLTLSIALLPLYEDVKNKNFKGKNIFKKLSWSGYVMILLAGVTIYLQRRDNANKEAEKAGDAKMIKDTMNAAVNQ